MMRFDSIQKIFFVGIGGIGMSAIARFFKNAGKEVSGYDRTPTSLTRALIAEGISVVYEDDRKYAMEDADAVVYTPAIPKDSNLLQYYRASQKPMYKRAEILGIITRDMTTVAVAGTHGKTTTSAMIAHLLRDSGVGCNAFLGGVVLNYNSNYWPADNDIVVVEADEYDRSFLQLHPNLAVLTSMDADHLDIYDTEEACQQAFVDFTKNIKPEGTLIYKHGLAKAAALSASIKETYSLQNDAAKAFARNIQIKNGTYKFDIIHQDWQVMDLHLPLGGMHNVENCVAAVCAAMKFDLHPSQVRDAMASFKGIKRRFEYVVKQPDLVYIDDYAHHPEELRSLVKSARTLFPGRKIVLAFQPHLYTRTRDFADGFAGALDVADEVLLLDIYPAREQPIEGVSSEMIKEKMGNPNVTILSKDGLIDYVRAAPVEVFITAGAGDIDQLVEPIKTVLETRK